MLQRHGQTDLRLRLGNCVFPVHKSFISAASPMLAGMVSVHSAQGELLLRGRGPCGAGARSSQE